MKLGIITDIHEDIDSLFEAISALKKRGCNEIICLGDITGFELPFYDYRSTRNARECVGLIRDNCSTFVLGNHDLFTLREVPNHQAGFAYLKDWYDIDYSEREALASNKVWLYEANTLSPLLGRSDKEYLSSAPEYAIMEIASHRILFSHSLFPDPTGSLIWAPEDLWNFKKHFQTMSRYKCDLGFSGHFHPNGFIRANEDNFELKKFGKVRLKGPTQIICPCIARGNQLSGVTIFDSVKSEVEVIPLRVKKS